MLEYIDGNIFDSPAQTIVNTVNTVGVMGKGLALAFKERYPEMFKSYRTMCEKHKLTTGKLMICSAPDHMILLFPTKENWRNPSRLEYIESGLSKFVSTYADHNITSIAFPKLGCGNGELNWDDVRPLMERYLKPLPIDVFIYLSNKMEGEPEHRNIEKTSEWLKENAKDLSFVAVRDEIVYKTLLLPYDLTVNGKEYNVTYKDGIVFDSTHSDPVFLKENDFFELWDDIRSKGVFTISDNAALALTYALLHALGYLSSISLMDNDTSEMKKGYQVREGIGRTFVLKGNNK